VPLIESIHTRKRRIKKLWMILAYKESRATEAQEKKRNDDLRL